MAINNAGQIVGDSQAGFRCFIYAASAYTTFTVPFPNAHGARARGINDSGEIVGDFTTSAGGFGYLKKGTTFSILDSVPGSRSTSAGAINNRGKIVGKYTDKSYFSHGFLFAQGHFTTIDPPDRGYYMPETEAVGINDADHIVGYTQGGHESVGYLYVSGTFSFLSFPGAKETYAKAINNHDQVVGYYKTKDERNHGFLYANGTFVAIDVPEMRNTWVNGINDRGEIVGTFDNGTEWQGFVGTHN